MVIVRQLQAKLKTNKPFFVFIGGEPLQGHKRHIPHEFFKNHVEHIKITKKYIKLNLSIETFETTIDGNVKRALPPLYLYDLAEIIDDSSSLILLSKELAMNNPKPIKAIYTTEGKDIEIL